MNQQTILVVDDDKKIRKLYSSILKGQGYNVETAKTGIEALQKSKKTNFDLALIDYQLPDMKGTELLTALKETIPSMIKIMVIGFPSLNNTLQTLNNGAHGYLVKPVKIEELLNKVNKKLKKQKEKQRFNEDRVVEFVKTKTRKLKIKHLLRTYV